MSKPKIDAYYKEYIVDRKQTSEGEMEMRECPLCRDRVADPAGWRPTVFLSHLSIAKNEHQLLAAICKCGHARICHMNSESKREVSMGPCSFCSSCGCNAFLSAS